MPTNIQQFSGTLSSSKENLQRIQSEIDRIKNEVSKIAQGIAKISSGTLVGSSPTLASSTSKPIVLMPSETQTKTKLSLDREKELQRIQSEINRIRNEASKIAEGIAKISSKPPQSTSAPQAIYPIAPTPIDVFENLNDVQAHSSSLDSFVKTLQNEFQRINQRLEEKKGLLEKFISRPQPTPEELRSQVIKALGLPTDFTEKQFNQLVNLNNDIAALNTELANLKNQEQQALLIAEQRPIPLPFIQGEKSLIERQFAIKKSALAGEIAAKTSVAEMIRGNVSLAENLIDKAVDLLTFNQRQEREDLQFLIREYSDALDSLTNNERQMIFQLLDLLKRREDLLFDTQKEKLKLWTDAATKGVFLGSIKDIKDKTLSELTEEYSRKVASTVQARALYHFLWEHFRLGLLVLLLNKS